MSRLTFLIIALNGDLVRSQPYELKSGRWAPFIEYSHGDERWDILLSFDNLSFPTEQEAFQFAQNIISEVRQKFQKEKEIKNDK